MSNPYASQQRAALENAPPQATEGYALIELARRLDVAAQTPEDLAAIRDVVRLNWRVWTIFQSELVDPDCPTPQQIRENLLSLSNFIDKRSAELIAAPDAAKLPVLININRQIGAGLMGSPSDDPEEAERLRQAFAEQNPQAAQGAASGTPPQPGGAGSQDPAPAGGSSAEGSAAAETDAGAQSGVGGTTDREA